MLANPDKSAIFYPSPVFSSNLSKLIAAAVDASKIFAQRRSTTSYPPMKSSRAAVPKIAATLMVQEASTSQRTTALATPITHPQSSSTTAKFPVTSTQSTTHSPQRL
jgi:hypothetical protein